MEKQLNFMPILSLQKIVMRKVVVLLWSESISVDLFLLEISPNSFLYYRRKWQKIFDEIVGKVSKLEIPAVLKKIMMVLVKPIGLEMLRSKQSLLKYFGDKREDVNMQILKQLCWTSAGEVDYKKTAERLVRLGTLDLEERFRLASLNYLPDCVPDLWEALPVKYKTHFCRNWVLKDGAMNDDFFWRAILREKKSGIEISFNQEWFQYTAVQGNKAGAKHFFQKLTKEERVSCIYSTFCQVVLERFENFFRFLNFFPKESLSDVMFYLLSEMSSDEQAQVFKEYSCQILVCFLDWPLHDHFSDFADVIWTFIPENKYEDLLNIMIKNFGSLGYYSPDIFWNFFQCSPSNFKKFFVQRDKTFLPELFNMEDARTIEIILRSLDVVDRIKLVSSISIFKILDELLMNKKCDLIKLCLRVATESVEDMERVKTTFMGHAHWSDSRKWEMFFKSLNGNVSLVNKRISEGETSTSAKKAALEEERLPRNRFWHSMTEF